MTPEIREEFTRQAHEDLAAATALVWKAQNALGEQIEIENLAEINAYISDLHYRCAVLLGFMVRWQLLEGETSKDGNSDTRATTPGTPDGIPGGTVPDQVDG